MPELTPEEKQRIYNEMIIKISDERTREWGWLIKNKIPELPPRLDLTQYPFSCHRCSIDEVKKWIYGDKEKGS